MRYAFLLMLYLLKLLISDDKAAFGHSTTIHAMILNISNGRMRTAF